MPPAIVIIFIIIGIALRVWQYAGNASLWLDEIALVRGILERSLWDLMTAPLPYDQVAPKGFLLVEKAAVAALGSSEYALRAFPLACSITAVIVFWRLAARVLDGPATAVAVALFAMAPPLITFAGLVKQYATDVCAAVLLLWLAVELESRPVWGRRALWLGVAGAGLVWFSQPTLLIVAAVLLSVTWFARSSPIGFGRRLREIAPVLILWCASALASLLVSLATVTPETREYLAQFWTEGFPPVPLVRILETSWPRWQIRGLVGSGGQASLGYPVPDLYAGLAVIGVAVLWWRNQKHALLLAAPIAVTLAAAVARQYPFSDRLIVCLVPSFLILLAASIGWIRTRLLSLTRVGGNAVAVALVAAAIYPVAATPPIYNAEDMKAVLAFVRGHRQPDDEIYVYYGAAPAIVFYAPLYGFGQGDYAVGGCHRGNAREYLRELDTLRSRPRAWVLMTHPFAREREHILRYLDTIGSRRQAFVAPARAVGRDPSPGEALLYDLSDPDRLKSATAVSFPLTDQRASERPCRMVEAMLLPRMLTESQ